MKLSPLLQRILYLVFVVVLWAAVVLADMLENTSVPALGTAVWFALYAAGITVLWFWLPKVGLPKALSLILLFPIFGLFFATLAGFVPYKKQTK